MMMVERMLVNIHEGEPPPLKFGEPLQVQDGVKKVTIDTLSGVPQYYTFKMTSLL